MPQNIFLFLEPSKDKYRFPMKVGYLYMNRFVIDETDANEIIDVFEFEPSLAVPSHINTEENDTVSHDQIDQWDREILKKRNENPTIFEFKNFF